MPPEGFEPTLPASDLPQTNVLEGATTGIGFHVYTGLCKVLPITRNIDPTGEFLNSWNTISLLRKTLPFEVSTLTAQSVLSDNSQWHLMLSVKWLSFICFHIHNIHRCEYYVLRISAHFWKNKVDCHVVLGKWATRCTNFFYVFISIYNSLHVSNTTCSSSGETNCNNIASGNSHSMLVTEMCEV